MTLCGPYFWDVCGRFPCFGLTRFGSGATSTVTMQSSYHGDYGTDALGVVNNIV